MKKTVQLPIVETATFADAIDSCRCAAAQRNASEALRWCAIAATLASDDTESSVYHSLANDIQTLVLETAI